MRAVIRTFFENPAMDFDALALEVFAYQYAKNSVYRTYCDLLKKNTLNVKAVADIPFLPIHFFKSHHIVCSQSPEETIFYSSRTTGTAQSTHHVLDVGLYETSYLKAFQNFYGTPEDYAILALLPSYLEQGHSSLVFMVAGLIKRSKNRFSNFYLNNTEELMNTITAMEGMGQKTLLIGVSYALLDLAEVFQPRLKHTLIIETGGMKGRRKEMIREELHRILCNGFGVPVIHSEYGMTELLSQAYSLGNGIFRCPHWMRIYIREEEDPISFVNTGKTGCINVIDLANIDSCAFIATQDLGRLHIDDTFEVLGRSDNSDIRGCNLMLL